MKPGMIIALVAIMTIGSLGTGFLGAQETGGSGDANLSEQKADEGSASAIALLGKAGELVQYARENESPLSMLAAVEMLDRVPVRKASDESPQSEPSGDQVEAGQKGDTPAPTLDRKSLLKEARAWAQGDEHVLALINAEMAETISKPGGTLGAKGGAVLRTRGLPGRTRHNWKITFRGRSQARVMVIGDGDTDLDLYVYDENGNLIAKDNNDFGDKLSVAFTPKWTGPFMVRIVNLGRVNNRYLLMTN